MYYLINSLRYGQNNLWAGSEFDDVADPIAGIQAAGGLLVKAPNPVLALAAKNAAIVHIRGGSSEEATAIMLAAYASTAVANSSGGTSGVDGRDGLPGADGLGIAPDFHWAAIAAIGGVASAELATIAPSIVSLPNGRQVTVTIQIKVWELATLATRGTWEFDLELARVSNTFSPVGVVDTSAAIQSLPSGFGVELEIAATGIIVRGNAAANAANFEISAWLLPTTVLATDAGTTAPAAVPNPTAAITTPVPNFSWVAARSYRIVGTYSSAVARVVSIELMNGSTHLGWANIGANQTFAADVLAPDPGSLSLTAVPTTIAGTTAASAAVAGVSTTAVVPSDAPVIDTFVVAETSSSRTIQISAWTAHAVAGGAIRWIVTVNSTDVPSTSDGAWTTSAWTSVAVSADGVSILRAYCQSATGTISAATIRTTTVDSIAPVVTAFTLPATSELSIAISSLTGTDATGIVGWAITEDTAAVPAIGAFGSLPSTITASGVGSHVYRAYAIDALHNISDPLSATVNVVTAMTPVITAFEVNPLSNTLAAIPLTFTATNAPTEYALIVQAATSAAPTTPTTGWTSTAPTTVTPSGSTDGYFTAYLWARNSAGTSTAATSNVLVLQSNASLSAATVLTPTTARVTFTYDFATAGQLTDWPAMGGTTRAIVDGQLQFTGGTSNLRGAHWQGLTSRTAANNRIQLETAVFRCATTNATSTLGNLVYGHTDAYDGSPFNPSPGYMLDKELFGTAYEINVNGAGGNGGTLWTPAAGTFYDITYTFSSAELSIAIAGHGSYSRTAEAPYSLANSPQRLSIGPYESASNWDTIALTGVVTF